MLKVEAIPAFDDNYIWLISDAEGHAAIVDPGDEEPVIEALGEKGLVPVAILITHKHYDHVGGIEGIKSVYPDCQVWGPENESISHIDHTLSEGDDLSIPGMTFKPQVFDVPGHTEGHIAYYADDKLFCGDTLFACGCGRVFSGTMAQLHHSLDKISQLPESTQVYCAHEYTLDNIGFAKWVEPENSDLLKREQDTIHAREKGVATVPSMLGTELLTNPFLRVRQDSVIAAAERYAGHGLAESVDVFTAIRQWKDREYD